MWLVDVEGGVIHSRGYLRDGAERIRNDHWPREHRVEPALRGRRRNGSIERSIKGTTRPQAAERPQEAAVARVLPQARQQLLAQPLARLTIQPLERRQQAPALALDLRVHPRRLAPAHPEWAHHTQRELALLTGAE